MFARAVAPAALLIAGDEGHVLIDGGTAEGAAGPEFEMHDPFPAAQIDGRVTRSEQVRLGRLALVPATPEHRPGAFSSVWRPIKRFIRTCATRFGCLWQNARGIAQRLDMRLAEEGAGG